jgi:hypothetical protein
MKKVSKSVLKAKMFKYFRGLEEQGGELIVTESGKPVLKILPFVPGLGIEEAFKDLRDKARIPRDVAIEGTKEEWGDTPLKSSSEF